MLTNIEISNIFKALADANRINIILLLQNGEHCACNMSEELGLAQSKLSYHMKILIESGLVECRYAGKWSHYKISDNGFSVAKTILDNLADIKTSSHDCVCSKEIVKKPSAN